MSFFKMRKKKPEGLSGSLKVLAAQTLKIASINGLGKLDKLENELEDEIQYENQSAKTWIGRLRREGHHRLHSKPALFIVVALNLIDTLLVLSELVLDFVYFSDNFQNTEKMLDDFNEEMELKYGKTTFNISTLKTNEEQHHVVLRQLLNSHSIFDTDTGNTTSLTSNCAHFLNATAVSVNQSLTGYVSDLNMTDWTCPSPCFQPYMRSSNTSNSTCTPDPYHDLKFTMPNKNLVNISHKLHYFSIAILAVLVLTLLTKVFCTGRRFFNSKMEIFDGFVVITSFVLDLAFLDGVHHWDVKDAVIVLIVMLIWRILRMLNSLIVAVLDKQRLKLRMMYTQKKRISRQMSESTTKIEVMERQIQHLQALCASRGVGDIDMQKALEGRETINPPTKTGKEKSVGFLKHKSHSHHNGHQHGLNGMMALGKLAFQAADALAPITKNPGNKAAPNGTRVLHGISTIDENQITTETDKSENKSPARSVSTPAKVDSSPSSSHNNNTNNGHIQTVNARVEGPHISSFNMENEINRSSSIPDHDVFSAAFAVEASAPVTPVTRSNNDQPVSITSDSSDSNIENAQKDDPVVEKNTNSPKLGDNLSENLNNETAQFSDSNANVKGDSISSQNAEKGCRDIELLPQNETRTSNGVLQLNKDSVPHKDLDSNGNEECKTTNGMSDWARISKFSDAELDISKL